MMNITRKAIYVLCLILATSFLSNAQIAINSDGSSPDLSAMLDVTSSSKGVLVPRMTTTQRVAISSPATGLLVYDTDFNTFWYYANSAWNNLSSSILTDADADTKIQVEESSDDDIIRFDLNGTEFMRLDSGKIEVLNTGGSVFLGEGAGTNDNYSDNRNTFIGHNAGTALTTGYRNVYLGYKSGAAATSAYHNIYLGFRAGFYNTTGNSNTFIGYDAGFNNITGDSNVFLGNNAGYSETGSNKLYIENSNASSPLIYGEFDNDLLRINGTLNINSAFSFPIVDGSASQVLQTDGSGNLSWSSIVASDDQTIDVISFSNNTLSLSLESDGESNKTVSLSSLELSSIEDGDNDTKIDVSYSDEISFQMNGTEYFRMDGIQLEVFNSGSSIFIGENAGENDDLTSNINTAIGYKTLEANVSGAGNVAIGAQSLLNSTSSFNTSIGNYAGYQTTGSNNTLIGYSTGQNITTGNSNVMIGINAGGTSNVSKRLFIDNSNTDLPLIYGEFDNNLLRFNGTVGIGISPTKAMFEIDGTGSTQSFNSAHGMLTTSGASTGSSNVASLSLYASSNIAANAYIAFSDARIKNIQGISNGKKDLNTLMNIEITDYTMKDTIGKGSQSIKKVIAQQVAKVYPQAVNTNLTDVIPNVYKKATIQNGWVSFNGQLTIDNGQLKVGEKVQIIFKDKKEIFEVLETKGNSFRIETLHCNVCTEESTVFIYGRQVDDFHTVDYEAISMLNVSATQQLAKEVEKLKKENELLKAQVSKIDKLEAMLSEMKMEQANNTIQQAKK